LVKWYKFMLDTTGSDTVHYSYDKQYDLISKFEDYGVLKQWKI